MTGLDLSGQRGKLLRAVTSQCVRSDDSGSVLSLDQQTTAMTGMVVKAMRQFRSGLAKFFL